MSTNTVRNLNEVFIDIYNSNIKDTYTLKKATDLYDEFKESVYMFLSNKEMNKTIYHASSAYYLKCGCHDVHGTVQDYYYDEKNDKNVKYEKEISLSNGDLLHEYYLYLFTQTKTKGLNKGKDYFTILFNNANPEDWTKITAQCYKNWIKDLTRTSKPVDSLERILFPDSESEVKDNVSTFSGEMGPSSEDECISAIVSSSIINSLAKEFFFSHPEDFVAFRWRLNNKSELFKPKELVSYFEDCLIKAENSIKKNTSEKKRNKTLKNSVINKACKKIIYETLIAMTFYGLNLNSLSGIQIDCSRIESILNSIYIAMSKPTKEKETYYNAVTHSISSWYGHCKKYFSKNSTVVECKCNR